MSFLQSAAGSPRVEHLEKLDQVVSMATTLGSPLHGELTLRDPVLLFVDGMPLTSLTVVCA